MKKAIYFILLILYKIFTLPFLGFFLTVSVLILPPYISVKLLEIIFNINGKNFTELFILIFAVALSIFITIGFIEFVSDFIENENNNSIFKSKT